MEADLKIETRLPEPVEVAAYYVVAEALTNAAKHAHASLAHVGVQAGDGHLHLSVRDDGVGGADPALGSGLTGLTDRVQALGGTITIHSPTGHGTTLQIHLPTGLDGLGLLVHTKGTSHVPHRGNRARSTPDERQQQ